MRVHNVRERAEVGQPFFRLLMSDLHLGAFAADHDAIVDDLAKAKAVGARVLINGDVFDAIGPMDRRFDLGVLHPSIRDKKDLANAIVDLAYDLLHPYRHIIDVMGIGNHEEAWIKYNHGDPVRNLINKLNADGAKVQHGSVWGWINTGFRVEGYNARPRHKLLYLHGTGGDSPVTKGTIDFNRKGRNWSYDCLTFGHKHNYVCSADQIADLTPAGKYCEHRQLNLQTGAYYRNYRQLGDAEVLDYTYAAKAAHPPKPMGGIFLALRPMLDPLSGRLEVRQDFASDVVIPWTGRRRRAS